MRQAIKKIMDRFEYELDIPFNIQDSRSYRALSSALPDAISLTSFDFLIILFAALTASVMMAGKGIGEMLSIFFVYISLITVYIIITNFANNHRRIYSIMTIYTYLAGAIALVQLILHKVLFASPMITGEYYVLAIPVAMKLFATTKRKKEKIMFGFLCALQIFALVKIWSGGGWAWASVILAFFIIIGDWRLTLIGGAALLFLPIFIPQGVTLLDITATSSTVRVTVGRAVLQLFDYYWIKILGQQTVSGVLFLIAFVIIALFLVKETFTKIKKRQTSIISAILAATGSGVTGLLYSNSTLEDGYGKMFIFWVFISIYATLARLDDEGKIYPKIRRGGALMIDIAVVCMLTFVILSNLIRPR